MVCAVLSFTAFSFLRQSPSPWSSCRHWGRGVPEPSIAELYALIKDTAESVKKLERVILGNGDPTKGFVAQVLRMEDFLRDEFGYSVGPRESRPLAELTRRVTRLENIIYPIVALVTPVSIWALIEIVRFIQSVLFHTAALPIIPIPTPGP